MSDETTLEITCTRDAGVCRASLQGEATIYTALELKSRLLAELHQSQTLLADLSQVHEIDTAGLQVLVLLELESQRLSKSFRAVEASSHVHNLVSLYGLNALFGLGEQAS